MADTTFVSKAPPPVSASWLQDLNDLFYRGTKALMITTLSTPTATSGSAASLFLGTGAIGAVATQLELSNTSPTNRWIKITGSNGGNPSINLVGGGNLNIVPNTIFTNAITILDGGSASGTGSIRLKNGVSITCNDNSGALDITLLAHSAINGAQNVIQVGTTNSNGSIFQARSNAGVLTTSDISAGQWTIWRDTSGSTTRVYYNNAGALQFLDFDQLQPTKILFPFAVYGSANLAARNSDNTGTIRIIDLNTVNALQNIIRVGDNNQNTRGVQIHAFTSGVPTTSDLPSGWWALYHDVGGGTFKIYYNAAGAMKTIALA